MNQNSEIKGSGSGDKVVTSFTNELARGGLQILIGNLDSVKEFMGLLEDDSD